MKKPLRPRVSRKQPHVKLQLGVFRKAEKLLGNLTPYDSESGGLHSIA